MRIVLASASPRRKEILEILGLDFKVEVADIDETFNTNLTVYENLRNMLILVK